MALPQPQDPALAEGDATIVRGDALDVLRRLPDGCAGLVYADPPFNTGRARRGLRYRVAGDADGARRGYAGRSYRQAIAHGPDYRDSFDSYIEWLRPLLTETRRVMAPHASLHLHVDPRESHYCKVLLDEVFGRACFLNEIIWAYDFGARTRRRWAPKHDVILVYVKDPRRYHFDIDASDRLPYLAPRLQTPERLARGKTPTDVWWQTIVGTTAKERTGYPTQKPLAILRRIVAVSSRPGDLVLDWCAGSGTTGAAAHELGRRFLLVDSSADAVAVMRSRLRGVAGLRVVED